MYLGLAAFLAIPAQGAFAWQISDLNPLPYIGIGENHTNFSLNPFTGFKNCNPCKKVEKCNRCAKVEPMPCPTCQRAFVEEAKPDCGCRIHRYYYND